MSGTNIIKKWQQKDNQYLDHLIDPGFQGVDRLFVLSFEGTTETSYKRYFFPAAEIKNFNDMIDGKNDFNQPVKIDLRPYDSNNCS